jgi:hypothetical protein
MAKKIMSFLMAIGEVWLLFYIFSFHPSELKWYTFPALITAMLMFFLTCYFLEKWNDKG